MVSATGFDRKTLMLATQLANESNMRNLLLAVLEALLETMGSSGDPSSDTEALTLARCIIRLIVKLIGEPGSNRYSLSGVSVTADVLIYVTMFRSSLVQVLIGHFRTGVSIM